MLKIYENLTFKKRFTRNFRDKICIIVDKLAEIEYLRKVVDDTNFEECQRINELKDDIYEFLIHIRQTIFSRPGLCRKGQKIISKCLRKEVWEAFAVEDACLRFADCFEYKDDLRDLMYRVFARMAALEDKLLDDDKTVLRNWIEEL